eukprot:3372379-Rhodomonas_salina.2
MLRCQYRASHSTCEGCYSSTGWYWYQYVSTGHRMQRNQAQGPKGSERDRERSKMFGISLIRYVSTGHPVARAKTGTMCQYRHPVARA